MTLPFLEKLLQVLAQGGFSATYKYAVLLALIDLCVEAGHPPTSVSTSQVARRVVELYWPQVRPFTDWPAARSQTDGELLRQNRGSLGKIAALIWEYRQNHPDQFSPPRVDSSGGEYADLLREVEWKLVEMPLPRLQRVGGGEERFIYEIGWDEGVSSSRFRRYARGDGAAFDNRILFVDGAADALVALAAVIRPLVQQQWLVMVRAINGLPEARLESFLFGADRVRLGALHKPLRLLQSGTCFYCGSALGGASEVDHFVPWARSPDDGLDNLVLAHDRCNRHKLHHLADVNFGRRWRDRSLELSGRLDEIAAESKWSRDRVRTFGVAATAYRRVPDGVRLWMGERGLRRLGLTDLPEVHRFGRELADAISGPPRRTPHGSPP